MSSRHCHYTIWFPHQQFLRLKLVSAHTDLLTGPSRNRPLTRLLHLNILLLSFLLPRTHAPISISIHIQQRLRDRIPQVSYPTLLNALVQFQRLPKMGLCALEEMAWVGDAIQETDALTGSISACLVMIGGRGRRNGRREVGTYK